MEKSDIETCEKCVYYNDILNRCKLRPGFKNEKYYWCRDFDKKELESISYGEHA